MFPFRINFYRGQNETIEVKNSNHALDDPNKDHNGLKDDIETRLSELIYKNPEIDNRDELKVLVGNKMLKLRINPIVARDRKKYPRLCDYL